MCVRVCVVYQRCVQNLMDHAVHARRGFGARNMASTLRKVLDGFHSKKKERGVDDKRVLDLQEALDIDMAAM